MKVFAFLLTYLDEQKYRCSGDMSEWARCTWSAPDFESVQRTPWKMPGDTGSKFLDSWEPPKYKIPIPQKAPVTTPAVNPVQAVTAPAPAPIYAATFSSADTKEAKPQKTNTSPKSVLKTKLEASTSGTTYL